MNLDVETMPFIYKTKGMCKHIGMPLLTQNFKVWINYTDSARLETRLSVEDEVITELIRQLPPFDSFRLNLYCSLINWLPFYWQGFTQTTRYTYVIEDGEFLALISPVR